MQVCLKKKKDIRILIFNIPDIVQVIQFVKDIVQVIQLVKDIVKNELFKLKMILTFGLL